MSSLPEMLGTGEQIALLEAGAAMHRKGEKTLFHTYYGRTVGVVSPSDAPVGEVISLTRQQGSSHYTEVSSQQIPELNRAFEACNLQVLTYARWSGADRALEVAQDMLGQLHILREYQLDWLSPQSDLNTRQGLFETCRACGVLLPNLAVLSGRTQPGVCPMLKDSSGQVIACAAAAAYLHPEHLDTARTCWWGMLAVHPEHRGKALSLVLGAQAMAKMNQRYGFSAFFTGVEPGNTPSERICAKMGFEHGNRHILSVTDPKTVPGGRMTK